MLRILFFFFKFKKYYIYQKLELPKNLEFINFFSDNFFSPFTFEIKNYKWSDRMTEMIKLRFSFSSDDCAITVYVQGILVLLEMWLPK